MKPTLLTLAALALSLLLQGCRFFTTERNRDGTDSSPITISDDQIHYHQKHLNNGFTPDPNHPNDQTWISADETNFVAIKIILDNCQNTPPCTIDLNGNPWSAQVMDQSGNVLDQINASSTAVEVHDMANDGGFKKDMDDTQTGKGYYHDAPNPGGGASVVGSLAVTVNGTTTSLMCPSNNCRVIAQYCKMKLSPDPSDEYKCK